MRFFASAVVLGLGALAATPCLALTIQTAPPTPDVALHLHATAGPSSSVMPAPDDLKSSFAASGRSQLGQGYSPSQNGGTSSFSFGPVHGTTTVTPAYGATWSDNHLRDTGNPLSLTPRPR